MNKRPLDKTKKSNIKCEHCKFWCEWSLYGAYTEHLCKNPSSLEYNNQRNYWNRCKQFEWAESEETDGTNKQGRGSTSRQKSPVVRREAPARWLH